jgi:serine/threonine protein kinase
MGTVALESIGDYDISELLGSGTVGDAFRAKHRESGQLVVIKLLQTHAASEPEIQRRFVREVSIAEKLNHPNIVRHIDCGLSKDQIYFAMELVEGGTLKDVLRRRSMLPWREAVECAIQICAALEHAHQVGVIHRDLKPANLFLSADGHVKVGDFGLARDLNSSRLTMDGQTVGTCRYMPPEQIAGEAKLTGAVDLYALGCILYEMLVGRTPVDGNTIVEIFEGHLNEDPTPPIDLVDGCPQDLSDLVMQLLAKSPEDRPTSAAAVQSALSDILHDRPMRLSIRPAAELAADLAAASHPDRPNLTHRLHTGGRNVAPSFAKSRWAIVLGVLAALIVVAIVVSLLR